MHGGKPWMTEFDNPFVQAAGRAIEQGFGQDAGVQPRRRIDSGGRRRSRRSSACRPCSSASACPTRTRTRRTRSSISATSTAASSRRPSSTTRSGRAERGCASRSGFGTAALLAAASCSNPAPDPGESDDQADLRQDHRPSDPAHLRPQRQRRDRHLDRHGRRQAAPLPDRPQRGRRDRSLGVLRRSGQAPEGRLLARTTPASPTPGDSRGPTARSRGSRSPPPATRRRSTAGSFTTTRC